MKEMTKNEFKEKFCRNCRQVCKDGCGAFSVLTRSTIDWTEDVLEKGNALKNLFKENTSFVTAMFMYDGRVRIHLSNYEDLMEIAYAYDGDVVFEDEDAFVTVKGIKFSATRGEE